MLLILLPSCISNLPRGSAQLILDSPVRIEPGCTRGFGIYTNSLCGIALCWPSPRLSTAPEHPDDKDAMGLKIGEATVPIVSCRSPLCLPMRCSSSAAQYLEHGAVTQTMLVCL